MKLNLPVHPTMRHPLTGVPLQALYVDSRGRARYPIMGGAPDDGGDSGGAGDQGGDKGGGAGGDAGAGDQGKGDDGKQAGGSSDDGKDLGFPANTPVADMKPLEQIAYHKHQSRKHEERATAYRVAAGGKSADEIKAELEAAATLRREKQTEQERAVEDAARQAREAATSEYGPKAVRAAFDLLLGDMPQEEREAEIELLDLKKFLNDSGDVDTAKVRRAAEKIAPADKGPGGRQFDFGAGKRGGSGDSSGVAAGRQLFEQRRKKSTPTQS